MSRKPPKNFEAALNRLDVLTQKMQQNDISLEDALTAYEEGCELLDYCRNKLTDAEQKLSILENGHLKEYPNDEL